MPMSPEGYRHSMPMEVRFADLDALGHVNNATYLTYMETARLRYVRDLGFWDLKPMGTGLIMAKAVVEYKLPLLMSDEITIYTRISRLGNKSSDMEHLIVRQDGAVASYGLITLVVYDYSANKSVPIPDAWRQLITEYEPVLAGV